MSKYVKNDSGVTKTYAGKEMADQEIYELSFDDEHKWAKYALDTSSNLNADVTSGDAKVSKDGVAFMSVGDGLAFLQNTQSGIVRNNLVMPSPTHNQVLKYNLSIEKWECVDASTLASKNSIDFNFVETDNSPFIEMGNNNNYLIHSVFVFGGTTNRGTPTKITVLGNNTSSGKFADVRIRDVTNNQTIAEGLSLVDYNGGVPEIRDLGTISNLSSGAAKWEFQVRKSATDGNKAEIYSLHIDFG